MGLFADTNINNAKISGGKGFPLLPGNYVLSWTEAKAVPTRKHGNAYEVFFKVEETDNPEQAVGSVTNEFCIVREDYGAAAAKSVLVAAMGLDAHNVADTALIAKENWDKAMELSVTNPKVFAGRKIRCHVVNTEKQKKAGEFYPRRQYGPHEETRAKYVTAEKK